MRKGYLAWTVSFFGLVLLAVVPSFAGADIALNKPQASLGVDIMQALQMRKSTKSYITKEIGREALSNILWASHGVNRENGKRTAPSAMGRYYMDLYVASNQGVHLYAVSYQDPSLKHVRPESTLSHDLRPAVYQHQTVLSIFFRIPGNRSLKAVFGRSNGTSAEHCWHGMSLTPHSCRNTRHIRTLCTSQMWHNRAG